MTNSSLETFYDNINNVSSFLRIRKTYELTNNLDPYLLFHLKRDFTTHYIKKLKQVITEKGERTEGEIETIFGDVLTNYDFENYLESFDFSFWGDEQECLYSMYDEINDYISELEDLQEYLNSQKTKVSSRGIQVEEDAKPFEGMNAEDYFEMLEKEEAEKLKEQKSQPIQESIQEPIQESFDVHHNDIMSIPISMKIIYLEKLGVIDFLQKQEPFNMSINSLANVFGRIIGAKPATVQPYLNAMLSRDVNTKNNPLNSEKNVESVEFFLSKLGYKLRK